MARESGISWCDGTWNPGVGCRKVSEGCRDCYMMRDMRRYGRDGRIIHRTSDTTFRAPLKRRRDGSWAWPDGMDVFTASWSDWWLPEWDAWRADAWEIVRARPGIRFLVLSKRPENITAERLPEGWPLPNVLLGVSVENAAHLWRARALRAAAERWGAAGLFVSAEPLLGSLRADLGALEGIDSFVAGGESGSRARASHPDWFRELRDYAGERDRAFHFKQWGRFAPAEKALLKDPEKCRGPKRMQWRGPTVILNADGAQRDGADDAVGTWRVGDQRMVAVGEVRAGRLLDGMLHDERFRRAA